MAAIVTLTMSPTVGVSTTLEQVVPNRKLHCSEAVYEPSGGGINVSRAIRRLGGESLAIFTAGGDMGARLTRLVGEEGIDARPLAIEQETRVTMNATESATGNVFRFGLAGPELRQSEWSQVIDLLVDLDPAPEYIVASGPLPPGVPEDFYGALSALAGERGIKLIVDTSGIPLRHAVGPGTFLLKPNLHEVRELAGGLAFSDLLLEGMARSIVAAGKAKAVAISMGGAGAMAIWPGGARQIAAPTVPVVSRIGAGDSMVAGIVVALTRGLPLEEAIAFGVAAGSAAVMNEGTELCRRDDVERLYQQMSSGG